jgi:hypothetical protein
LRASKGVGSQAKNPTNGTCVADQTIYTYHIHNGTGIKKMIKFTKKEIEALEILEAGNLPKAEVRDYKNRQWFASGVNTAVLRRLVRKGAAEMCFVLGGKVTDVEIIISPYAAKSAQ